MRQGIPTPSHGDRCRRVGGNSLTSSSVIVNDPSPLSNGPFPAPSGWVGGGWRRSSSFEVLFAMNATIPSEATAPARSSKAPVVASVPKLFSTIAAIVNAAPIKTTTYARLDACQLTGHIRNCTILTILHRHAGEFRRPAPSVAAPIAVRCP